MDLTLAAATVLQGTTNATNATAGKAGGAISNETFGLWFVLLLILAVLVFLFWE